MTEDAEQKSLTFRQHPLTAIGAALIAGPALYAAIRAVSGGVSLAAGIGIGGALVAYLATREAKVSWPRIFAVLAVGILAGVGVAVVREISSEETTKAVPLGGPAEWNLSSGPLAAVADDQSDGAWVTTEKGDLYNVDGSGADDPIELEGKLFDVDVGLGFVWTTSDCRIHRIKPGSDPKLKTRRLGHGDCELSVAEDGVWFKDYAQGRIYLLNTGLDTERTLRVDAPNAIAPGPDRLWVTQGDDTEAKGRLLEFGKGPEPEVHEIAKDPQDLVVTEDAIWINHYSRGGKVSRYDLESGQREIFDTGVPAPSGLAHGAGAVWISSETENEIGQVETGELDPESRGDVTMHDIGGSGLDIAVNGLTVYAPNVEDGAEVEVIDFEVREVEK